MGFNTITYTPIHIIIVYGKLNIKYNPEILLTPTRIYRCSIVVFPTNFYSSVIKFYTFCPTPHKSKHWVPKMKSHLPLSIKELWRIWRIIVQFHPSCPGVVRVWHIVKVEKCLAVSSHHCPSKLIIKRILFIKYYVCCFLILLWKQKKKKQVKINTTSTFSSCTIFKLRCSSYWTSNFQHKSGSHTTVLYSP